MFKQLFFSLIVLLSIINSVTAQNIGINNTGATPDASAILDVSATNMGVLIPRTDTTTVNAAGIPATSLLIYQTNDSTFYSYNGSRWVAILDDTYTQEDTLAFIADEDLDTYIHTEKNTDENIIRFYSSGTEYFRMDEGRIDVLNTGKSVFIGEDAGASDNMGNNYNVAIGYKTFQSNTNGYSNVVIGAESVSNATSSANNSIVGSGSYTSLTTGQHNASLGNLNASHLTTGSYNTSIGSRAMYYATGNISRAVAIGYKSLAESDDADNTVALGYEAGNNSDGGANVFIGYQAGKNQTVDNQLYIENSNSSTPLIWGDFDNDSVKVYGTLGIQDVYTLPTSDGSSGQVMSTDGSGIISWSTVSTDTLSIISDDDKDTYIHTEESADDDIVRFYIEGTEYFRMDQGRLEVHNANENITIGEYAGETNTGTYNVLIGRKAGRSISNSNNVLIGGECGLSVSGVSNTMVGSWMGLSNTISGGENVGMGSAAFQSLSSGSENLAMGTSSMRNATTADRNVALGYATLLNLTTGQRNVAIGNRAGYYATGSNSIFLGYDAGAYETGDNKLYIENSNSSTPLIWGDFDNDFVKIYGSLGIQDVYTFPTGDGTSGQIMSTDGSGNLFWTDITTDNLGDHTATQNIQSNSNWISNDGDSEGLYIDASGNVGVGTSTLYGNFVMDGDDEYTMILKQKSSNFDPQGIAFQNTGFWYQWGIHRDNKSDLVFRGGTVEEDVASLPEVMRLNQYGVGIAGGVADATDALEVGTNGDGTVARANAWNTFSDRRWKRSFERIPDALEKLEQINGYYYNWLDRPDTSQQVGVIAQEIEAILPQIVSTDTEGYKSVDYSKLTALLIQAIKEQQQQIKELKLDNRSKMHVINQLKTEVENNSARIEQLQDLLQNILENK